jgi:hypothetical protein
MMKAVVILCIENRSKRCKADISLAHSVDRWWFEEREIIPISVTPYLPIYLANWLKKRLEAQLQSFIIDTWKEADVQSLAAKWVNEAMDQLEPEWREKVRSWLQKSRSATAEPAWERHWIEEDAYKILPYIEGRRWLFEHVEKRMKMVGISLRGTEYGNTPMRQYLPHLLQYLYLEEEIELTAGITIEQTNGKIHLRCERCGSENYGIYLHYCSSCDQDEPVCDTCYVMGTSKGCSLVISRPKPHSNHIYETSRLDYELVPPLKWSGEL